MSHYHYFNIATNVQCEFHGGYIGGNNTVHKVGTPTTEEECAMLVYKRRADAIGATFYSWGCYAEYGNFIRTSTYKYVREARSCFFTGTTILFCLQFLRFIKEI